MVWKGKGHEHQATILYAQLCRNICYHATHYTAGEYLGSLNARWEMSKSVPSQNKDYYLYLISEHRASPFVKPADVQCISVKLWGVRGGGSGFHSKSATATASPQPATNASHNYQLRWEADHSPLTMFLVWYHQTWKYKAAGFGDNM